MKGALSAQVTGSVRQPAEQVTAECPLHPTPYTLHPSASRRTLHPALGFTLVELLISITILAGMTIVSVQKFRLIQQDSSILAGAGRIVDVLRRTQNLAQTGTHTDYPLAQSYGVHIAVADSTAGTVGSAFGFVDINTMPLDLPADGGPVPEEKGRWNGDLADLTGAKDAQIGAVVSADPTGFKDIVISEIAVGDQKPAEVDIAFLPPDAAGRIDGAVDRDIVVITVKNVRTDRVRKVSYSRVSGRIDISN